MGFELIPSRMPEAPIALRDRAVFANPIMPAIGWALPALAQANPVQLDRRREAPLRVRDNRPEAHPGRASDVAHLPSGTVAFLFTDVEGSTRQWERDRETMQTAVARHFAVLRDAITAHHGVLFKQIGDAAQAAFGTVPDAVAAALDGQRALAAGPHPLRVRMAVHVGEAVPDERGDYLAPCLNRLARLLATGHGGQILMSSAAAGLARDTLPPDTAFLDLGSHRLRDFTDPETIWQLVAPGLQEDFPPLATLERHPTNFPVQPTPLVGRAEEVERLRELFANDTAHLVTLTGPGGIGKTRLALQVAAEVMEAFPDGVFFVDLTPIVDPSLVVPTVAAALGMRPEGGRTVDEALEDFLAGKRLMLVLDNLERLVAAAPALAGLLAACPDLRILATSREPLRLRAEREFPVIPLAVPDPARLPPLTELARVAAVDLFVRRAQATRPDFALTPESGAAVAGICARLEGLPLAIELAAARIKFLPPEALFARLDKRLPLLTGGARDLPARQRTLRDAIAWSHDLLTPEERTLFRRLAVFAGGGTLAAIETICTRNGDVDALAAVAGLVDRSLVRQGEGREGEPRFGMLETVREFAVEQLDRSGEGDAIRQAHAVHYLAWAEAAEPHLRLGNEVGAWIDHVAGEHDNLRAALTWFARCGDLDNGCRLAASLGHFWIVRGHFTEGREWFGRFLDAAGLPSTPTDASVDALIATGQLARLQGDFAEARRRYNQGLEAARTRGDRAAMVRALSQLGYLAVSESDVRTAEPLLDEAAVLAETAGCRDCKAASLHVLGSGALAQGDLGRSRVLLDQAVGLLRTIEDHRGLAQSLSLLAAALAFDGELDAARARAEESLDLYQTVDDRWGIGFVLGILGIVVRMQGDPGRAVTLLTEAIERLQAIGVRLFVAVYLGSAARALADLGAHERAARLLGTHAALRATMTGMPFVPEEIERAAAAASASAALGEAAFARAEASGRTLSVEQAVAEVLRSDSPGTTETVATRGGETDVPHLRQGQ